MAQYNKFYVSALGAAVIAVLQVLLNSGAAQAWSTIIVAVISSITVWAVPNRNSDGTNVLDKVN